MPSVSSWPVFQSTLSMRRATLYRLSYRGLIRISIHALHEESDPNPEPETQGDNISIHALHEESDWTQAARWSRHRRFQSTLSMRRATVYTVASIAGIRFQSTLSMRRATHQVSTCLQMEVFQSTLSMRRATRHLKDCISCRVDFNPRSP